MEEAWQYEPSVDGKLAVELAQLFLSQSDEAYGGFVGVEHIAASRRSPLGRYHVEFAYDGPPIAEDERGRPPADHPTVVIVDDRSGACSILPWI